MAPIVTRTNLIIKQKTEGYKKGTAEIGRSIQKERRRHKQIDKNTRSKKQGINGVSTDDGAGDVDDADDAFGERNGFILEFIVAI